MTSLLFVTYELAPFTPGGAGTCLSRTVRDLHDTGKYKIYILALFDRSFSARLRDEFLSQYPGVTVLFCEDYLFDKEVFDIQWRYYANLFAQNSCKTYLALSRITAHLKIDIIEFFDFAGIAFHSLLAKRVRGEFADVLLAIRLHGSLQVLQDYEQDVVLDVARLRMFEMERAALTAADVYFTPSPSVWDSYVATYGIDPRRPVIVSPPHGTPDIPAVWSEDTAENRVLVFGKVQKIKGTDVAIQAFNRVLADPRFADVTFVIAGGDSSNPTRHVPSYIRLAKGLIAPGRAASFEFKGFISRDEMLAEAKRAKIAVVASLWESFCIALHEVKATGIPMVVNGIPAFRDYLEDEKSCLFYDGTVEGLARKALRLLGDADLRATLSANRASLKRELVSFEEAYATLAELGSPDRAGDRAVAAPLLRTDKRLRKRCFTVREWVVLLVNVGRRPLRP